jgi:hypothetical protein
MGFVCITLRVRRKTVTTEQRTLEPFALIAEMA